MIVSKFEIIKIQFIFLIALAFIVSLGVAGFYMSTRVKIVDITLKVGSSADIAMCLPLASYLSSSLYFKKGEEQDRPELGSFQYASDFRETGYLEFLNPGNPIKLKISIFNASKIYEALPSKTYGSPAIRDLVLFVDDGFPNRFPWLPSIEKRLSVPRGYSVMHIEVVEVGKEISGEAAKLYIFPPLAFMAYNSEYAILWFFYFWPVYTACLLLFAILLARKWMRIRREQKECHSSGLIARKES